MVDSTKHTGYFLIVNPPSPYRDDIVCGWPLTCLLIHFMDALLVESAKRTGHFFDREPSYCAW